jgi:hypothetical protein
MVAGEALAVDLICQVPTHGDMLAFYHSRVVIRRTSISTACESDENRGVEELTSGDVFNFVGFQNTILHIADRVLL